MAISLYSIPRYNNVFDYQTSIYVVQISQTLYSLKDLAKQQNDKILIISPKHTFLKNTTSRDDI